jgi:hypothetical protein
MSALTSMVGGAASSQRQPNQNWEPAVGSQGSTQSAGRRLCRVSPQLSAPRRIAVKTAARQAGEDVEGIGDSDEKSSAQPSSSAIRSLGGPRPSLYQRSLRRSAIWFRESATSCVGRGNSGVRAEPSEAAIDVTL